MSASDTTNVVKLAPSDLTFLWEECPRCFWLKAKGVLKRPSAPFPKIFTRIDQQTKDHFFGRPTEEMAEGLRPGRVAPRAARREGSKPRPSSRTSSRSAVVGPAQPDHAR